MFEIKKPILRRYWIAYDKDVIHAGWTDPDQVTSTGLSNLTQFNTERDQKTEIARSHSMKKSQLGKD